MQCTLSQKIVKKTNIYYDKNHRKVVDASLLSLLNDELLCDIILIAANDNTRIPAHRVILSANSEYFKTMFNCGLKEAFEKEVIICDISGDVLKKLVLYCYTGKIEIDDENAEMLIAAASLMLLNGVIDIVSKFLIRQLNPGNCLGFCKFAKQFNCHKLEKKAKKYAQVYFNDVIEEEEFLNIGMYELEEYLGDNFIQPHTEGDIFRAIMAWVNYKKDMRQSSLTKLLHLIRIAYLEPNFFEDYFKSVPEESNRDNKMLVNKSLDYLRNKFTPRQDVEADRILIATSNQIYIFKPKKRSIKLLYTCEENLFTRESTVIFKNKLISVSRLKYIDLKTGDIHSLPEKNTIQKKSKCVAFYGSIFVMGGYSSVNNEFLPTVERFDFKTEKWESAANMLVKKGFFSTLVFNNKIYVFGGRDTAGNNLDSVECYNPVTNQWTHCSPMHHKRALPAVVAVDGYIYVFGGRDRQSLMSNLHNSQYERYEPQIDSWSIYTSVGKIMPSRKDSAACLFDGEIYFFEAIYGKVLVQKFNLPGQMFETVNYFEVSCNEIVNFSISSVVL